MSLPRTIAIPIVLLGFFLLPGFLAADPLDADPALTTALVTVEGEAALRDRLRPLVALVKVTATPALLEDPRFVVARYGQAVRVDRGIPDVVLLTSGVLVDGAGGLEVSVGAVSTKASVRSTDPDAGLADLVLAPGSATIPNVPFAPAEACVDGHRVFFLAFAGDYVVIGNTRIGPSAGAPIEKLRVVPGHLPEGTPLFDVQARLVAVTIRPLDHDRSLVAPLCPEPPPPPPPPRAAQPSDGKGP